MNRKPLLTFCVGAYNHERFIEKAVEGAFAQTYSPLQILLSDDCSSDKTFEIMSAMAAAYRGPHKIILNRNDRNLGLAGHVNRAAELMGGELLILSAGDDISLAHRSELTWMAWEGSGRRAKGVCGEVVHIDQAGNLTSSQPASGSGVRWQFEDKPLQLKSYLRTGSPVILGATAAWSRSLFERFGPIREDLTYEDMALGFRARLSGGISFIGAPLIKYRLHDHNLHHSSNGETMRWSDLIAEDRRRKTGLVRKRGLVRSFYADLEKAGNCGLLEKWECTELMSAVERFEKTHALELDFRNAWLPRRLRLFPRLAALQSERTERFELAYRLLPCWTYYAVRLFKAYVRKLALQR